MNKNKDFEILGHTADIRLRAYGKNKNELFRNALLGMMAVLKALSTKKRLISRKIQINSIDENALLVDFLNEALYFAQAKKEAYRNLKVLKLTQAHLAASLKGIKVKGFEREIKGISYQGVEIKQKKEMWEATIIFDI